MAYYVGEPSHAFSEYLLVPGYTPENCIPANVSLKTPVVRYRRGEECPLTMNVPMVSAVMQAVSGPDMGIALAREGGIAFIFVSQPVEQQAEMIRQVKAYKAGFAGSDANLRPEETLADVLALTTAPPPAGWKALSPAATTGSAAWIRPQKCGNL